MVEGDSSFTVEQLKDLRLRYIAIASARWLFYI